MKILLPFYSLDNQSIETNIHGSGVTKFCQQICQTFDDVEVLQFDKEKIGDYKKIIKEIKERAVDADIIISNYDQASFCGAHIVDSNTPIMMMSHSNTGVLSILIKFQKLIKYGHSIFLVSPYQKNHFDKMAKRVNRDTIKFSGFISSSYCSGEVPNLIESEYEVGTIGRCDPRYKKPFLLKEMLQDTGIRNLVIANIEDDKSTYYLKNKNQPDTMWDLPHDEVMKNLAKCKTYFLTFWQETWSITALEALSHGIPIIANSKNNVHASNVISAKDSHYKNISLNSKEELIGAIHSFDGIDRKEIQDMTWEKHSHKNWKANFSNAIDMTIEKFKNDRNSNPHIT